MAETKMRLVDWLDDLCVRFIINMPKEELESVERICFQVEEAQWFYEDFIRPIDPTLPSMNLRKFALLIFQHCPLLSPFTSDMHETAYEEFLAYRQRVPVRGAIMLNDTMDHVVLVKGWKKGSRWSFPRGKINKDEKDLDCAIREVYEETGFEIREAGLVKDEENEKYIEVSMRDQHIRLYVFRDVPMNTHFEARTRKEISAISWYKLWDLPTLKRQRQNQGTGDELLKDSMFYMVAPFLGTLKHWIKQQHKLDRARVAKDQVIVETDTEMGPVDESAVLSGTLPEPAAANVPAGTHDGHFNTLLAGLRQSSIFPESDRPQEMSAEQIPDDPAAALKRLLSVSNTAATTHQGVEGQAPVPSNPLLAMLQGNQPSSSAQSPMSAIPPRTPPDQIKNVSEIPQSPHHQHPQPPLFSKMPPAPSLAYTHNHQQPHPIPRPSPQQYASTGMPPNRPGAIVQPMATGTPLPHGQQMSMQQQIAPRSPAFGPQGGQASRAYQQTRDLQTSGVLGPASPPASKLPAPRLNAHSLSLLSAFKSPMQAPPAPKIETDAQRAAKVYAPTRQAPEHHNGPHPLARNSSGLDSLASALSPEPQTAGGMSSPEQVMTQEPHPPKNEHHNALLHLFRTPSTPAAAPALKLPQTLEPVELSAQPSPGLPRHPKPNAQQTKKLMIPSTLNASMNLKPGMTSATVSGPLNSPDFDTVRQKSQVTSPVEPTAPMNTISASAQEGLNAPFAPMTILQRPKIVDPSVPVSKTPPVPFHSVSPKTQLEQPTPRPFQPYILRRSQQTPSPVIPTPQVQAPKLQTQLVPPISQFDRREHSSNDQKSALLSIFGSGRQTPGHMQQPPQKLAQNPTLFSGIISPVSPLPEKQHIHPAAASEPRSRISSLNSTSVAEATLGDKGKRTAQQSPVTPVDRNFLLGYLQSVVKGSQK